MTLYLCVSLLTFSGVFGSAARVFNRAADLADVGGAAVVRVSEAAVDAVHHGLSLGADLWSGIELQNVQLRKQRGQWRVEDGALLADWWASPDGRNIWNIPDSVLPGVLATVGQVGIRMPYAFYQDEDMQEYRSGHQVLVAAALQPSGYTAVELVIIQLNFTTKYVNPLWVCQPQGNRPAVLDLVRKSGQRHTVGRGALAGRSGSAFPLARASGGKDPALVPPNPAPRPEFADSGHLGPLRRGLTLARMWDMPEHALPRHPLETAVQGRVMFSNISLRLRHGPR
jgi:hypothetical protein